MIRGLATALVNVLMVGAMGTLALLIGLIYPARWAFAFAASVWARSVLFTAGVDLRISGRERIVDGAPRFLVGNHQSALDIPIVIAACGGNVRFMAKESLFRIPVLGWVIRRYGFAPIDRSRARKTAQTLDRMLERLRHNPISVAVFPEGTRTRDGRLLPFRRGTMKIAKRAGFPIVPFTIDGSFDVLQRDALFVRPGVVRLTLHEEISAEAAAVTGPDELCDRLVSVIGGALDRSERDSTSPSVPAAVQGS